MGETSKQGSRWQQTVPGDASKPCNVLLTNCLSETKSDWRNKKVVVDESGASCPFCDIKWRGTNYSILRNIRSHLQRIHRPKFLKVMPKEQFDNNVVPSILETIYKQRDKKTNKRRKLSTKTKSNNIVNIDKQVSPTKCSQENTENLAQDLEEINSHLEYSDDSSDEDVGLKSPDLEKSESCDYSAIQKKIEYSDSESEDECSIMD